MRKRACTDLCGGRSAMVVPTATVIPTRWPSPSMRRPVSVKSVFVFLTRSFWFEPGRLCRHPAIRTVVLSDGSLGASWASSVQQVLLPDNRPRLPSACTGVGPGLGRSHLNSAVESAVPIQPLRHGAYRFVAVPQGLIDFPAHPQLVKQYGQLPCYGNDRSLLGILPSAFSESQPPAP